MERRGHAFKSAGAHLHHTALSAAAVFFSRAVPGRRRCRRVDAWRRSIRPARLPFKGFHEHSRYADVVQHDVHTPPAAAALFGVLPPVAASTASRFSMPLPQAAAASHHAYAGL